MINKPRPIQQHRYFFFGALALRFLFIARIASAGTPDSIFFAKLEGELRSDYFSCTGDTTQKPIEALVVWKHWTDSLIGLPDYHKTEKEYTRRTGRSPVKDGPCTVALWKRHNDSLAAIDSAIAKQKADLLAEVHSLPKLPCALDDIPFGITRQSFVVLAGQAGFGMLSVEGDVMVCQTVPVGRRFLTGLFHFDKNGGLDRYELQGTSFPIDSLRTTVWKLEEYLTSFFWKTINAPPLRVNRVNQQDIVEDKLSISTVWSDPKWSVAVGISVQKYRYYAKAVVTNQPLLEE